MPYVQSAKNFDTQADSTVSFGSNVTSGSLIVIGAVSYTTSTISSVTDSQSNTYTRIGSDISSAGDSNNKLSMWYAKNVTGGAVTVTVHSSSGTSLSMFALEWGGVDTSGPLDQEAHQEQTGTNSPSSGNTSTLSQADELVVGLLMGEWATNISVTAGSGYTLRQSYTDGNVAIAGGLEDKTVSSTSAVAATFTLGTIASSLVRVATFKLSTSTDATVNAVVATATAAAVAPAVSGGSTVVSVAATATATALAPQVSASASITAVVTDATATAIAPTVSAGSTLTPPAATATATALAPTVSADATVVAPVATATATAYAPTVNGVVSVTAVVADATAAFISPTVSASALVTAVVANATARMRTPGVFTGEITPVEIILGSRSTTITLNARGTIITLRDR